MHTWKTSSRIACIVGFSVCHSMFHIRLSASAVPCCIMCYLTGHYVVMLLIGSLLYCVNIVEFEVSYCVQSQHEVHKIVLSLDRDNFFSYTDWIGLNVLSLCSHRLRWISSFVSQLGTVSSTEVVCSIFFSPHFANNLIRILQVLPQEREKSCICSK